VFKTYQTNDAASFEIIKNCIYSFKTKRNVRTLGSFFSNTNKTDIGNYRTKWCALLRYFWKDTTISELFDEDDVKQTRVEGSLGKLTGYDWIIDSIAEYLFDNLFRSQSRIKFKSCPHKLLKVKISIKIYFLKIFTKI
jgi:hypothetical protein